MNKVKNYSEDYFVYNHLRHINSRYGFLMKMYYRYLALYCMAKPANLAKGGKVLDIGCGVGILAEQFNKLGYQTIGVDVNKTAIENSVCPKKCLLVEKTSRLDFPDNYFDLIVSREVLEHIPLTDIDACIKEWDRAGKGKMIHIIAVSERGKSAVGDPAHINVKPEKWWVEKFKKHGYKALKNPSKLFFSPFGSSGYFMFCKG